MHRPLLRSNAGRISAAGVSHSGLKLGGTHTLLELRVPLTLSSFLRFVLAMTLAGTMSVASAEDAPKDRPQSNSAEHHEPAKGVLPLPPADSATEHSIDTPPCTITYARTAGPLAFYNQSGEQSAPVFYTAYVAKAAPANRPLTFVFNGGPGAASAFLHLGLVGPRILDFGPDSHEAARAILRDNPDTWLSFTDLVLIDPVGTGWSRTVKPDDGKNFWSIRSDASSMANAL